MLATITPLIKSTADFPLPACCLSQVDAFRREIALMARIDHTNVLDLLDSFARPEDGAQAAVYPYCAGVALEKYIRRKKKLDEQTSIYFLRQLAAGLDYLRARDVALRMLSARNCLLYVNDQRPSIQIADFSTAGSVATGRPALDLDDLPLLSYLVRWDGRVQAGEGGVGCRPQHLPACMECFGVLPPKVEHCCAGRNDATTLICI